MVTEGQSKLEQSVEIPEGFVRCNYDGELIKEEEAFKSPYGRPYCNEDCYIMFVED